MIFILTQPRIPYYAWQIEAALYQNERIGMDMSAFHVVCGFSHLENDLSNRIDVVEMYERLERRFPDVQFFYYQDDRQPITYIPSIVPHLLKKHWSMNRWLAEKDVFLTDCDQLFISKPDYSDLLADDYCYVSDSRGFINHSYLTWQRPDHIVQDLEQIVGLEPGKILAENDNSGGSHYLVKKLPLEYFEKVERDANAIYDLCLAYNRRYDEELGPEKFYGVQAWGAFMWSLLYNLWYFGKDVRVTERLAFCWGSDLIEKWNTREIFHNAGVTHANSQTHNLFYKGHYTTRLPYDDVMNTLYNPDYASNEYAGILREIAPKTCLVVS